ncbi:MAG: rhodanese-like domain-containing protein [Anaerolineae bacterium]|jgi:rhodanese-related sulfurtransferase|nr:rhodanese-like domain-containing protein [Anaerolineae bacterium]
MKKLAVLSTLLILALAVAACGAPAATGSAPAVDLNNLPANLTVQQAKPLLGNPGVFWLDVREQSEYDAGHIPDITLIPTGEVAQRLAEIPKDKPVVVTCRSGNRSAQVTQFLREQGYTNVHNMEGGILAWQGAGFPVEK